MGSAVRNLVLIRHGLLRMFNHTLTWKAALLLAWWLSLLAAMSVQASPLSLELPEVLPGKAMRVVEEIPGQTPADILSLPDAAWSDLNGRSARFGYSDRAHWFRVELQRPYDLADNPRYLVLDFPLLDAIDIILTGPGGNVISRQRSGDTLPFESRPLHTAQFMFPLDFRHETSVILYLRVQTQSLFYFTPAIISELSQRGESVHFLLEVSRQHLLQALFFGLMIAMILYNSFLYHASRDENYLFYVAYCLLITLYEASVTGLAYQFLWPDSPALQARAFTFFGCTSWLAASMFAIRFLESHHWPWLHRTALLLCLTWTLLAFSCLWVPEAISTTISNLTGTITLGVAILLPILAMRRGDPNGATFLIAWTALIIGTSFTVLTQSGLIEANGFTSFGAQQLGVALETLLLSNALSRRMELLRSSAQRDQQRILKSAQGYTAELEKRVRERESGILSMREQIRETQKKVIESEKAATLEALTRAIVLDLTPPKEAILDHAHSLQEGIIDLMLYIDDLQDEPSDSEVRTLFRHHFRGLNEATDLIYNGFFRVSNLVEQLSVDTYFHNHERAGFLLDDIARECIARAQRELDPVTMYIDIPADLRLHGWEKPLGEAIFQLTKNAIQAACDHDNPSVTVSAARHGEDIHINVTDNGHGIRDEFRSRIFDPFFTTRAVGDGTGIGLTITRNIVHRHGGEIECTHSSATGTTLQVRLPG